MKIKVGQWARTKDNKINKIIMYIKGENTLFIDSFDEIRLCDIFKVADNPQGLVQKGDLVTSGLHHSPSYVMEVYEDINQVTIPYNSINIANITAIYTPNSNGDYIKQWEIEE